MHGVSSYLRRLSNSSLHFFACGDTSCGGLDAYTATQLGCWCCDKADEPGSAQDTEAGAHTHEALPAHVEFILLDDHISHVGMQVGNSYVATERSM